MTLVVVEVSHFLGRIAARSADALLDVEGSLSASRADGMAGRVSLTERGCSLGLQVSACLPYLILIIPV